MNLLSQVAVPTDRNPDARAPHGCPLEHVFVLQLIPLISVGEQTMDLSVTLCKSEYRSPDQIIMRKPPRISNSCVGMLACKTRRSHWQTTYSGNGSDSRLSVGVLERDQL